jgi:hypothetical protein
MRASRPDSSRRRSKLALTMAAATAVAVLAVAGYLPTAEAADDIDLLRTNGGTPYVFFLVDTSGSMVLNEDNEWVMANGDDPDSKIYQVKKALYEVMRDVENVHFGFASFNQDRLMVRSKHWLYRADGTANLGGSLGSLTYPTATGEVWTFGRHLDDTGTAGTCASPLSLSSDLAVLNRFARLGVRSNETTTLWVRSGSRTFRVQASLSPDSPGELGDPKILVSLQAARVVACPLNLELAEPVDVTFERVRDFLMVEANGPEDEGGGGDGGGKGGGKKGGGSGGGSENCTSDEFMDGLWPYTDVLADNTCGSGSSAPHTGKGWEGNTDSGNRPPFPPSPPDGPAPPVGHDDFDRCCVDPSKPGVCDPNPKPFHVCYDLHFPTSLHPSFDELDLGDQIPFNWEVEHKDEFLRRLNPLHPGGEDFGIASYFQDEPDTVTGLLQLEDPRRRPLIAFGNSPLGRAITDFRCWYLGRDSNKCKGGEDGPSFDPGWEAVFRENDLEYGCRVPYLIVISDGEDNSAGPAPTSEVANLFSKAGIRTFAFTFEDTTRLHSIVQAGKGEKIVVDNGDELATKLREIIGFIQEETRTFASAAVPSVQATVEDKIYLTNFIPLNDSGQWEGHVHSFLKPLPLDPRTGRPDTTHSNHLWDAAEAMLAQAPDPVTGDTSTTDLQIGPDLDQRRVYYASLPDPTSSTAPTWPENRRLFRRPTDDDDGKTKSEELAVGTALAREPDLWTGFGLSFDVDEEDSVVATRAEANRIIEKTLIEKEYELRDDDGNLIADLQYVLGDIFHSDPLVIGGPVNAQYFVQDAEETFDADGDEQGTGYREFFLRHENRRKIIVAGANDGMVHAWDAGKASVVNETDDFGINRDIVAFDNGTGREIFAYVPRSVLPTVRQLADDPVSHQWSVDGSIASADVFIDPINTGTPTAGERSWRTVLIGGLREGGSAYYALDITHPDEVGSTTTGPTDDSLSDQRIEVFVPTDQQVVPDCHATTGGPCDPDLSYGTPLWEFTDQLWDPTAREYVTLDEDANDQPDLGETWSSPDIGRIRVVEGGSLVNKYVAVFGGGLDPNKAGNRGNFLYMVDIETGRVIYKRRVTGSIPSDTAAVDTDQDGYLDRIYFGTTAGLVYRVDLVDPTQTGNARHPVLTTEMVRELGGPLHSTTRIESDRSGEPAWDPVAIFDTEGRPVYFPPTVLFVAELGRYALGLGTGDRDALGFKSDLAGRFYTFVDDSDLPSVSGSLPLTESAFEQIDRDEGENPNLLTTGSPGARGWFMILDLEERLISQPFGLAGVTFFATFDPQVVNATCEVGPGCKQNPQCSLSGNSRIYVVNTLNANALLRTVDDQPTRFLEVNGFVTEPFTEQGLSKNATDSSDTTPNADELTAAEREVMDSLRDLFPDNCRFTNARIDIKLFAADTRLQRIAAVPVCTIEKNWKEVSE